MPNRDVDLDDNSPVKVSKPTRQAKLIATKAMTVEKQSQHAVVVEKQPQHAVVVEKRSQTAVTS